MKGKRLSKILVSICLVMVLALALPLISACAPTPTPTPTPTPAWEPQGTQIFGAPGAKGPSYISGMAMLQAITDKTDVPFKLVPLEKPSDRAAALKEDAVRVCWFPAAMCLCALEGTLDYESYGPQSIRLVWNGGPNLMGLMVRGDSGIKTMSDMKGKRVATYPGSPFITIYYVEAALAFGNLTFDDVIVTPVASWASGITCVIDGSVDVAVSSCAAASSYEMEASVHGIHWLPLPASDTEAWARFHEINPGFFPGLATYGAGCSVDKPCPVYSYNYQVVAYDWQDENLAYWFTKQIAECYDAYKDAHAYLESWTADYCLGVDTWFVPWHQGSVRYFKDIGRWTPERESKQQEMLAKYPQTMTK